MDDFVREYLPEPKASGRSPLATNRIITTSHFVSYREASLQDSRWRTVTLMDWEKEEIERFVERFTLTVETLVAGLILLKREKTLVEGAGAVGFTALYQRKITGIEGKNVVVVLSGGNIDMTLLSRIIERGLEIDGRLTRIRVIVPDMPGSIAKLAATVASQRVNIFDLSQSRPVTNVQLGQMEVELLLETRGGAHVQELINSIQMAGFTVI